MKECEVFNGSKAYSDPSYIFSEGQDSQLPGFTPLVIIITIYSLAVPCD